MKTLADVSLHYLLDVKLVEFFGPAPKFFCSALPGIYNVYSITKFVQWFKNITVSWNYIQRQLYVQRMCKIVLLNILLLYILCCLYICTLHCLGYDLIMYWFHNKLLICGVCNCVLYRLEMVRPGPARGPGRAWKSRPAGLTGLTGRNGPNRA